MAAASGPSSCHAQSVRALREVKVHIMSEQRYVSDELTHFVGRTLGSDDLRYELLVKILTSGWLIAPGTEDKDGPREDLTRHSYHWSAKLSDSEGLFRASAACFCDIPVADFGLHVKKYSRFAVAFKKTFLIAKGAAPVFYVPKGVRLHGRSRAEMLDELKDELRRVHPPVPQRAEFTFRPPNRSKMETFAEDIVLAFIKPFDEMKAEDDPDNYYMEREWRTLTSIKFRLADVRRVVIPEAYATRFRENVPMYMGQVTFL